MKQAILDTSFILSAVRQKLDFIEKLTLEGFTIFIPNQVIEELERHSKSKKSKLSQESNLALKILETNGFNEIEVKAKYADSAIKKIAIETPEAYVATIDKEIQKAIPNKKIIIRGKNKIEIF